MFVWDIDQFARDEASGTDLPLDFVNRGSRISTGTPSPHPDSKIVNRPISNLISRFVLLCDARIAVKSILRIALFVLTATVGQQQELFE